MDVYCSFIQSFLTFTHEYQHRQIVEIEKSHEVTLLIEHLLNLRTRGGSENALFSQQHGHNGADSLDYLKAFAILDPVYQKSLD